MVMAQQLHLSQIWLLLSSLISGEPSLKKLEFCVINYRLTPIDVGPLVCVEAICTSFHLCNQKDFFNYNASKSVHYFIDDTLKCQFVLMKSIDFLILICYNIYLNKLPIAVSDWLMLNVDHRHYSYRLPLNTCMSTGDNIQLAYKFKYM